MNSKPSRDKYFLLILVFVVLVGLALRVSVSLHEYITKWDESFHSLVAKNFIEDPFEPLLLKDCPEKYQTHFWLQTRVWLNKPPFSMWLIALSLRIFGDHEFFLRLPSILADAFLIFLVGFLGRLLGGSIAGLVTALMWAVCPAPLTLVGGLKASDHPDVWLCVLSTSSILFMLYAMREGGDNRRNRYYLLSGVLAGLAVLTKGFAALPLVVPLMFSLFLQRHSLSSGRKTQKSLFRSFLWFCLGASIALPWMTYIAVRFPEESRFVRDFAIRHLFEALEGHEGGLLYHFERLSDMVLSLDDTTGSLIGLGIIGAIGFSVWRSGETALRILSVWVITVFVLYSLTVTKMKFYCMPAYPAVFIIASVLIFSEFAQIKSQGIYRLTIRTFLIFIFIVSFAVMTRESIHIIGEAGSKSALRDISKEYDYGDLRYKMKELSSVTQDGIVWNGAFGTFLQCAYYSGKTVLPTIPSSRDIVEAEERALFNAILVAEGFEERETISQSLGEVITRVRFIPIQPARR